MRFTKMALAMAGAVTLAGAATAANAAELISNGSFETGTDPGVFTTIGPGHGNAGAVTDWTVTDDDLDYIGTYWQAADGRRSLDLAGLQNGEIDQTIATAIGGHYLLSFWVSANPDSSVSPRLGTALVDGNGTAISYTLTGGNSLGNMLWQHQTVDFYATALTTKIGFSGDPNSTCCYGVALDNVSVTAVPEPATWAIMLTGMFGAGAVLRRRRRLEVAAA